MNRLRNEIRCAGAVERSRPDHGHPASVAPVTCSRASSSPDLRPTGRRREGEHEMSLMLIAALQAAAPAAPVPAPMVRTDFDLADMRPAERTGLTSTPARLPPQQPGRDPGLRTPAAPRRLSDRGDGPLVRAATDRRRNVARRRHHRPRLRRFGDARSRRGQQPHHVRDHAALLTGLAGAAPSISRAGGCRWRAASPPSRPARPRSG